MTQTHGRIEFLREERARLHADMTDIIGRVEAEKRDGLTDDEAKIFGERRDAIKALDATLGELEEQAKREATADEFRAKYSGGQSSPGQRGVGGAVVTGEVTYRKGDPNRSWAKDMVAASFRGDQAARDRLFRNNREIGDRSGLEVRALTTSATDGGEFAPPGWFIDQYVKVARAGRVTANLCNAQTLPPGVDSINLPKLSSGTSVAEQSTENTAVSDTDAVTTSVTADIATLAGKQVVSLQFIEQSPVATDEIILGDLLAELAQKVGNFVLNNSATNKDGILNVTGINAVTYTDTAPTVGQLYPKIADAIQKVHTGRFLPPTCVVMHPRRWAWITAALDSQDRPFVVPAAQGPMNSAAAQAGVVSEGYVGSIQGVDAYVDPNVPTGLGSGTNEDRIIVFRASDVLLYEGLVRAEMFREPNADSLGVLLRVYNYVALHSARYPKAISVISGSGLATPTF